MTGADPLRVFRLIPVPMHLDDPRWRSSWRRKPCQVFHVTEDLARETAAQFFKPLPFDASFSSPWLDPTLVACSEGEQPASAFSSDLGDVLDIRGGVIERSEAMDDPMRAALGSRTIQIVALVLLPLNILWMSHGHSVQIAQVREQAKVTLAELRSGPGGGASSNPLMLFQASLTETTPVGVTVRGTVYVLAYSASGWRQAGAGSIWLQP